MEGSGGEADAVDQGTRCVEPHRQFRDQGNGVRKPPTLGHQPAGYRFERPAFARAEKRTAVHSAMSRK